MHHAELKTIHCTDMNCKCSTRGWLNAMSSLASSHRQRTIHVLACLKSVNRELWENLKHKCYCRRRDSYASFRGFFVCLFCLVLRCVCVVFPLARAASLPLLAPRLRPCKLVPVAGNGSWARRTCLSKRSELADRQVTRYLVRLRNDPSTSSERWSREERWSMKDITRKPRFCRGKRTNNKGDFGAGRISSRALTCIMCCCTVCELSTSSQMNPSNLALSKDS